MGNYHLRWWNRQQYAKSNNFLNRPLNFSDGQEVEFSILTKIPGIGVGIGTAIFS